MSTVPHSGMSLGVTFVQWAPPSVVSWISPSSVPAQISPCFSGLSTTEKMVS